MSYDVGIIGGGVIGLSCAWRLAQAGASVAVFERGQVGREASWAAAGMLAAQCEAAHHPPLELRDNEYSMQHARRRVMLDLCLESRAMYGDFADELFDATGIDIELSIKNHRRNDWRTPGILYVQTHDDDVSLVNFAQQKGRGLASENAPDFNGCASMWLPDEGQVNNRVLVQSLRLACEQNNVTIYEAENVAQVGGEGASAHRITTSRRRVDCEKVVFCGGARGVFHNGLSNEIATSVKPVAGQIIALRTPQPLHHVIYASDVYLVPRRDGRVLVGATMEDVGFDAVVTSAAAEQLLKNAQRLLPEIESSFIEDQWAGLRPGTPDGLPILGSTSLENLYIATGHFRNGILLSPVTAKLMADCICDGIEPPGELSFKRFQKFQMQNHERIAAH